MDKLAVDMAMDVARNLMLGKIGVIEGSRVITALRFRLPDPDAEYLLPFRAVESETDHLPFGDERQHWSTTALREKDEQIQSYESRNRDELSEDCRVLIEALSSHSDTT